MRGGAAAAGGQQRSASRRNGQGRAEPAAGHPATTPCPPHQPLHRHRGAAELITSSTLPLKKPLERVICCTHFAQPLKRELIKQNQEQPQKRKATTQLVPSVSKSKPAICEAGKLRTETSPLAVLDPDYCRVHVLENKHCISLF